MGSKKSKAGHVLASAKLEISSESIMGKIFPNFHAFDAALKWCMGWICGKTVSFQARLERKREGMIDNESDDTGDKWRV